MIKNKFRLIVLIALAAPLVLAAADLIAARSKDRGLDKAVKKANDEWAAAMKTGDAAVIAAPYADQAVFVGVDGACVQGRNEIEKLYRTRFERAGFASSTKIVAKELVRDGDLAYESGYAEVGLMRAGKETVRGGRYLTVWQRQPDGGWKILRNIVLP